MNVDRNWVPMKWPCGPLEIARRNKLGSRSPDLKETLQAWARPSALELLKGTPINCLIVEWADRGPEDSAQQQALKPLLEAGRGMGLSFGEDRAKGRCRGFRCRGARRRTFSGDARERIRPIL